METNENNENVPVWAAIITRTRYYKNRDNYTCDEIDGTELVMGNEGESREDFISRVIRQHYPKKYIIDQLKDPGHYYSVRIDYVFQCTNVDDYVKIQEHPTFLSIKEEATQEHNRAMAQRNEQIEAERNRRDQQEYERLRTKFGN